MDSQPAAAPLTCLSRQPDLQSDCRKAVFPVVECPAVDPVVECPVGNPVNPVVPVGSPANPVVPVANPVGSPVGNPVNPVVNPVGNPVNPVVPAGNPVNPVVPAGNPVGNPASPVNPVASPALVYRAQVFRRISSHPDKSHLRSQRRSRIQTGHQGRNRNRPRRPARTRLPPSGRTGCFMRGGRCLRNKS